MDVRGEIAVAEIEPIAAPVASEAFQGVKRVAAESPAFHRVNHSRQCVGDDVEVRGNLQTVKNDIVTSVDDDRQQAPLHDLVKTEEQFRSADAARERGDFQFFSRGH